MKFQSMVLSIAVCCFMYFNSSIQADDSQAGTTAKGKRSSTANKSFFEYMLQYNDNKKTGVNHILTLNRVKYAPKLKEKYDDLSIYIRPSTENNDKTLLAFTANKNGYRILYIKISYKDKVYYTSPIHRHGNAFCMVIPGTLVVVPVKTEANEEGNKLFGDDFVVTEITCMKK